MQTVLVAEQALQTCIVYNESPERTTLEVIIYNAHQHCKVEPQRSMLLMVTLQQII